MGGLGSETNALKARIEQLEEENLELHDKIAHLKIKIEDLEKELGYSQLRVAQLEQGDSY